MTTHTVLEFGCWYCRFSAWMRHRFGRCGAWCPHCIAEFDQIATPRFGEDPEDIIAAYGGGPDRQK